MAAMLLATPAPSAMADDDPSRDAERPLLEGWPDEFFDPETFDRQKLSDEARRAVEDFLALIGPLMDRLSIAIEDLPRYEAPVILPNGDILIRRKRDLKRKRRSLRISPRTKVKRTIRAAGRTGPTTSDPAMWLRRALNGQSGLDPGAPWRYISYKRF